MAVPGLITFGGVMLSGIVALNIALIVPEYYEMLLLNPLGQLLFWGGCVGMIYSFIKIQWK